MPTGHHEQGVRVWRGIPFGKSPTGDLRFAAPQVPKKWTDTLNTTFDAAACIQYCELPDMFCPETQSEDCLFLNVFSPPADRIDSSKPFSTIVFIHGGNFKQGYAGGSIYDYTQFVNETNTIIVVPQYRLGALGFLYTEDDNINGNFGYLDQRLALEWVQGNIEAFGGSKDDITLSGQSAGGCSALMHVVDKKSAGLFQKVIMESIACLSLPLREPSEALALGNDFVKKLGCATDDTECLMEADVEDLLAAQLDAETDIGPDIHHLFLLFQPFEPTIGTADTTITMPLIDHIRDGSYSQMPMLLGTVTEETVVFVYAAFTKPMIGLEMKLIVDGIFGKYGPTILNKYPNSTWAPDTREDMVSIATDFLFTCVGRNLSGLATNSQQEDVFLYQFGYTSPSAAEIWGPNFTECWDRCCHASELPFAWNTAAELLVPDAEEVQLGITMQNYWANFAKTGDPNKGGNNVPVEWTPYVNDGHDLLYIDVGDDLEMRQNVRADYCDFWDELSIYDIK
jgi:carboxylesterase type B